MDTLSEPIPNTELTEPEATTEEVERIVMDEPLRREIKAQFNKVILELQGEGGDGRKLTERATEPIWLAAEIKTVRVIGEQLSTLEYFPSEKEARVFIEEQTPNFGEERLNYQWRQAVKYVTLYALSQIRIELPYNTSFYIDFFYNF